MSLKCDNKIQKSVENNFHHNITHILKVSLQGFIKEEEILILRMSSHAKKFYWRLVFFIHHELMYLSTSMLLSINFRILFSKPNPRNSSYHIVKKIQKYFRFLNVTPGFASIWKLKLSCFNLWHWSSTFCFQLHFS